MIAVAYTSHEALRPIAVEASMLTQAQWLRVIDHEAQLRFDFQATAAHECLHHYLENKITIQQLIIQLQHHFNLGTQYLAKTLTISTRTLQRWSHDCGVKPSFRNYCKVFALHKLIKELNRSPLCNSDYNIM